MIDLSDIPAVAAWRSYIDSVDDEWQRELEETCWDAFHYTVEDCRKNGLYGGLDGGITSVFRKAGKGGLCLRGGYNSMTRPSGWAHVRSQIGRLPQPLSDRVMQVTDKLGQRAQRARYNPMIAWVRTEATISADGAIVSWETHHPFLECVYQNFTLAIASWFDNTQDGWHDIYKQKIIKRIRCESAGTLDLREHGIVPAPGLVMWVRFSDNHGCSGGSRFAWPYGTPEADETPPVQKAPDDPDGPDDLVRKGAVEDGEVTFPTPAAWMGKGKVQIGGGAKKLDRAHFVGLEVSKGDGAVAVEWEDREDRTLELTVEWQPMQGPVWVPADGGPVDPVRVIIAK